MDLSIQKYTNNLSTKLLGVEYLFMSLGLLVYTDLFIYFNTNLSIIDVLISKESLNVSFFQLFQFTVYLTLLYSIISNIIFYIINLFILRYFDKNSGFVINNIEKLKDDAIISNNSSAYEYYKRCIHKMESHLKLKKLITATFILIFIDISVSFFTSKTFILLKLIGEYQDNIFVQTFLIFGIVSIVFYFLFTPSQLLEIPIDIDDYEARHKSFWLDEINSGLLDKNELLENLEKICKNIHLISQLDISSLLKEDEYKYCINHELIIRKFKKDEFEKEYIELTLKGNFFKRYLKVYDYQKDISNPTPIKFHES